MVADGTDPIAPYIVADLYVTKDAVYPLDEIESKDGVEPISSALARIYCLQCPGAHEDVLCSGHPVPYAKSFDREAAKS